MVFDCSDTCRLGAGRTYQGPTVPFNARAAHLFRHFPSLWKKLALFWLSFLSCTCWRFRHLESARFRWFSSGAPVSVTFSFFGKSVSFFLIFFLFCFSSILVLLSCSWGVRKKGFSFIFIPVGFAVRLSAALLVEPSC